MEVCGFLSIGQSFRFLHLWLLEDFDEHALFR